VQEVRNKTWIVFQRFCHDPFKHEVLQAASLTFAQKTMLSFLHLTVDQNFLLIFGLDVTIKYTPTKL
jgi:hypothetical protein